MEAMEASQSFESNNLAVPSPHGQYIASQTPQHIYIQYARSLETAFTFSLDLTPSSTTSRSADIGSIQWSHTSQHILLISTQSVSVFSLNDPERKVRISNGSAGLGRIVAADLLGLRQGVEQVMVVWEFGRVGVWDIATGHTAEELGDVKLGSGKLGGAWAIRREEGKAEVLALLSRNSAQDVLTLFLPPSTTPFHTHTLPTTDAHSITFHGPWLSVLDSPLASPLPSTYIYTPDGHLFRSYPPATVSASDTDDFGELGPKTLAWSEKYLALAESMGSAINLLSTRTFVISTTADPVLSPPEFCHQEVLSANGLRRYTFLASSSIPQPPGGRMGEVLDMKWNKDGSRLAVRYQASPSTILVWRIPEPVERTRGSSADAKVVKVEPPVMIIQHDGVRKLVWHPARESLLMIVGEVEGGLCLFDAALDTPPVFVEHKFTKTSATETGRVEPRWISPDATIGGEESDKLKLLVSSRKKGWFVLYPEGKDDDDADISRASLSRTMRSRASKMSLAEQRSTGTGPGVPEREEEGNITDVSEEDSLYDILTGRTPLPELGSGRMFPRHSVDDETTGLDDTFREKSRKGDGNADVESTLGGADLGEFDSEIF